MGTDSFAFTVNDADLPMCLICARNQHTTENEVFRDLFRTSTQCLLKMSE